MNEQKIIIGSRGSELALWQTNFIKKEIEKKNKFVSVEIQVIKTTGDKILDVALSKIGDKGLFTKELETALLNKKIDVAVHSLKDLQTQLPEGLKIGAVTKRHPVEDVLIARKKGMGIANLPDNGVVATGSLRRRAQLLHLRPDIKIVEIRGNVPGRIDKFLSSGWDGLILARAGLERLGLKKHISSYIPTKEILPAVGQGALGMQIRDDNSFVSEIVQSVHDDETYFAVMAEREFLKVLQGGCQVPIGAFAELKPNGIFLDGVVSSLDGKKVFRKKIRAGKKDYIGIGNLLARKLLEMGAGEVLKDVYNSVRKDNVPVS